MLLWPRGNAYSEVVVCSVKYDRSVYVLCVTLFLLSRHCR